MKRRRFLQAGLAGGAGMLLGAGRSAAAAGSRVCSVRNDAVFESGTTLNQAAVRGMLRSLVTSFTGIASEKDAWATMFAPADVVGIKVNAINGPLTSYNRQLVFAVAERLLAAGVPEANIVIFDRSDMDLARGGFTVTGPQDAGIRCIGAAGAGFEELPVLLDGVEARISRIITRRCTALINMPILRAHALAGMSFALKNMMGALERPDALHPGGVYRAADLYAVPAIRDRVRLIIGDCLMPVYDDIDEPAAARSAEHTLMLGTDPVAMDAAGAELLNRVRTRIKKKQWPITPAVRITARAAGLGLGTAVFTPVSAGRERTEL